MEDFMIRRTKTEKGFTLIELMVVLVILGIMVTAVVLRIGDEPDKARVLKAKSDIKTLETALKMYKIDNGYYPSVEQGLESLIYEPTVGKLPNNYKEGGYIEGLPLDPWGNPYIYISPGAQGRNYDLFTYGADGIEGGERFDEDIASWNLN
jgi:general secretion pathway protein G